MRLLCMRESKAWTKLMEMYGETSINRFATLQCSFGLNLTQAEIIRWRQASWSATRETGLDVGPHVPPPRILEGWLHLDLA